MKAFSLFRAIFGASSRKGQSGFVGLLTAVVVGVVAVATDYATMFGSVGTEGALAIAAGVTIAVGLVVLQIGPSKALGMIKRLAGRS
jgi:hypothetical protein